jgi:hydrogenase maturation protein HypF
MTSGNFSDEPICFSDDEAVNRLGSIVDCFLLHNRPIHIRMDDSVVRRQADKTLILRRSRGYAPTPIKTSFKFNAQILACGAELKNTFCLTRDNYAFISHHIGDLENLETLNSFTQGIQHYKQLLNLNPEVVVYDLHPEYLSTKYALETDGRLIKIGVQHHHAHIASCLVDNSIEGQVLGIAMDGLGFGEDGKFWGGEFLVANFACAERVAHLDYVAMPGATKAINEPWRMAASYLYKTFGDDFLKLNLPLVKQISENNWTMLRSMIRNGINSPESSSMGRLFDAVSSLLNIRQNVTYEGQAAIELENIVDKSEINCYEFELTNEGIIKAETLIKSILEDLFNNISIAKISSRFHWSVVYLIAKIASKIRSERHLNQVVLSGGVFQNMILLERTCLVLRGEGFEVFTHSRMPSNDGAISLGQAAIANARLAKGV